MRHCYRRSLSFFLFPFTNPYYLYPRRFVRLGGGADKTGKKEISEANRSIYKCQIGEF